jgi:hypothetical protein
MNLGSDKRLIQLRPSERGRSDRTTPRHRAGSRPWAFVVEGIGIVLHHHRVGVDAVALADTDDLAVEGHLIVVFPLLAEVAGSGTTAGLWIGICAGAELLRS